MVTEKNETPQHVIAGNHTLVFKQSFLCEKIETGIVNVGVLRLVIRLISEDRIGLYQRRVMF